MCSPEDNLLDVLSDDDIDVEISEIDESLLLGEKTVTTAMKSISVPPSQSLTSSEPQRKIIKLNTTTDKYSKIPPLLTSSNQKSFKKKKKFSTFAIEKKFKKTEPSLLLDTSTKSTSKTTSLIKNLSHDLQPSISQSSQQQQSSLFYGSRGISFTGQHDVPFTLRHLHSDNSIFNLNHLKS